MKSFAKSYLSAKDIILSASCFSRFIFNFPEASWAATETATLSKFSNVLVFDASNPGPGTNFQIIM